jgi:hypothetical protein
LALCRLGKHSIAANLGPNSEAFEKLENRHDVAHVGIVHAASPGFPARRHFAIHPRSTRPADARVEEMATVL